MFWWRGRGIWIAGIAAFFVLPLQKLIGDHAMAFGLAAAAVTVFLMRGWFGESSLFSIPAKIWPIVLLVFALISGFGKHGHAPAQPNAPAATPAAVHQGAA